MREISVPYDESLLVQWKIGVLPQKWAKKYPAIFDTDDLRLALSQPQYHFAEWFAAIYWYNRGWRSLIEQYPYSTHPKKLEILRKYLAPEKIQQLHRKGVQVPDLFVYKSKTKAYFFCEVKMPLDKIRESQQEYFRELEDDLETEVVIAQLSAITG